MALLLSLPFFPATCSSAEASESWDLKLLAKPPKVKWIENKGPVYALEYEALPYKGKITKVFAYYATPGSISNNPSLDKNLPGVILIHGGMSHAEKNWVTFWAKFGYAALAMDLQGCGPDLKPLPNAVPASDYLNFDYNYHMVANVILAHSLLLGFKEVDARRTAVTGISVGGQLALIAAALDKRFKVAVPIYGCGYLHENSLFSEKLSRMDKAQRNAWVQAFDPSSYVGSITIPVLFITGAEDQFYPLDSYVKTYQSAKTSRNLCIVPGLPHNMTVGTSIKEPALYIDQFCRNGIPLPVIARPEIIGGQVKATCTCKTKPAAAYLYCIIQRIGDHIRTANGILIKASITGSAIIGPKPPETATAWLLILVDERNATVSSEVIFK
jgi:cephalosporin-C deacetylase-like acetyl esterase